MRRTALVARFLHVCLLVSVCVVAAACGGNPPPFDAATDMGTDMGMDVRPMFEAAVDVPLQGRACTRSAQCDDGVDCTDDICGSDNRCVNLPNGARCDDRVYCNGAETCDMRRGCVRGEPVSCNDNYTCTADRCNEMTRMCEHTPLDRDGDGDPDDHCTARECGDAGVPEPDAGTPTPCWRGGDCDDRNPNVSSRLPEICGDMVDNNCNGQIDGAEPGGCRMLPHDTCSDPLDVSAGGVFRLEMGAARGEVTTRCGGRQPHDMVARFRLDTPRDVTLEGASTTTSVVLALETMCGVSTSEIDCDSGFPGLLRRHSLPAGDYFVIIGSFGAGSVDLSVRFAPPTPAPTNDTCATATPIPDTGGTFMSDLIGVADDVSTTCGGTARDVIYTFTLTSPRDVTLTLAAGRSDFVNLSLTRTCARSPDMVRCDSGSSVNFTAHELPAGTYFVVVESFEPVPFTLQVTFGAPTPPARGDVCENPLDLTTASMTRVNSLAMENDYRLSCGTSGRDAVLRFDLTERRDVIVTVRGMATTEFYSVAIASTCAARPTERTCVSGASPRAFALALDPGTYYVIVKASRPSEFDVQLETFPPLMVRDVMDNDTCATAFAIPPGRGAFRGNTTLLRHDYNAPCTGTSGGNDGVYSLNLATRQRVTLVTNTTFLHVIWIARNTGACPGSAPMITSGTTCTLGTRTTLDITLDAGDYWIFVDGLSTGTGGAGTYDLVVNLSPP